jgi:hypothetical protein
VGFVVCRSINRRAFILTPYFTFFSNFGNIYVENEGTMDDDLLFNFVDSNPYYSPVFYGFGYFFHLKEATLSQLF